MIDLENVRRHCLKKQGKITEEFPFDDKVLVFKVFGKMFLLVDVFVFPLALNLKCEPERGAALRERYPAIVPGYHMNKALWNTVTVDGSVPETMVYELIDHSYDEVVKTLPKKFQQSPPAPDVKKRTTERKKKGK